VTFVNPANLLLRIVALAKEHPYRMEVGPRSLDNNRYAGIFFNLHSIDLSVPSEPAAA
jgi:hypothetical protein